MNQVCPMCASADTSSDRRESPADGSVTVDYRCRSCQHQWQWHISPEL